LTASACVVVPSFLTVIVTLPALATFGLAGVSENSFSLTLSVPAAALELDVLVEPPLLLDEELLPHPAAATASNATSRAGTIDRRGTKDLPERGLPSREARAAPNIPRAQPPP
jgi:hypothetical protein